MPYTQQPENSPNSFPQNICCLIVEDNAFAADIMQTFLFKHGIKADIAENGKVALDMFALLPSRYNIIFMDLQMPVMNGYESAAYIRKNIGGQAVPIIAISGAAIYDLEKSQFTDSLQKPFKMQDLLPIIQKYCLHE